VYLAFGGLSEVENLRFRSSERKKNIQSAELKMI